jgi:hypothetical protein
MHLEHKAGDKLSSTLGTVLTDPQTGAITWVEVFLPPFRGCSQLTYCQNRLLSKETDFYWLY